MVENIRSGVGMEWKKKLETKSSSSEKQAIVNIKSLLSNLKNGSVFYSYKKGETLKLTRWNLELSFEYILKFFKKNLVVIFSSIPIIFALILMLAINMKQNSGKEMSSRITGVGGIGGIGELSDLNGHEMIKNEEDEAKKDQLLGADEGQDLKISGAEKSPLKVTYKVKEGDTLSDISKKFNVSVEAIAGSSGIRMIDHLQIGQTLQIPNKEGFFYSIKKGERLASIINKYNVPYDKFIRENSNLSSDLMEAGDEIFLPDAKPNDLIRSWMIPVPSHYITSGYGWRKLPARAFHKGLDLLAFYAPVRAAKSGRVTYSGRLGGYGNVIVIAHEGGYKSLYGHLSEYYVRPGTYVMQGAVIGKSGNTGYSTGPHLHFEVTKYGRSLNPITVLTGLRYYSRS